MGDFFVSDPTQDKVDNELLLDKNADERLFHLTGDLFHLCFGGVLPPGDGCLLGLSCLLGEYDLGICSASKIKYEKKREILVDSSPFPFLLWNFFFFFQRMSFSFGTVSGWGNFRISLSVRSGHLY